MSKNTGLKGLKRKDVEANAAVVFKLALPRRPNGRRPQYAGSEYQLFFEALKKEYGAERVGFIDTKEEGLREAYAFSGDRVQFGDNVRVVAVAHETGLEILFVIITVQAAAGAVTAGTVAGVAAAIAKGAAVKASADAIVAFSKWVWNKWDEARKKARPAASPKDDLCLVMRKVEERLPDGTVRKVVESEVYGPLDAEQAAKHFKGFLRAAS